MNGSVDGCPLGKVASCGVFILNAWDVTAAAEESLDISVLPAKLLGPFHVRLNARVPLEIRLHISGRFLYGDAKLPTKPKRANPVNDSEIDGFGLASYQGIQVPGRQAEHLAGRERMNVLPVVEGLLQHTDVRDVGEQPQLARTPISA